MSGISKMNVGISLTTEHLPQIQPRRPANLRRSKSHLNLNTYELNTPAGLDVKRLLKTNTTALNSRVKPKEIVTKPVLKRPLLEVEGLLGNKPSTSRLKNGVKRPAAKATEAEVKPRVAKKGPKVPDWDYKTRFNLLKEKHEALVNEHRSIEDKISEITTLTNENESLKDEIKMLENANQKSSVTLRNLQDQNENIQSSLRAMENEYEQIKIELEEMKLLKEKMDKDNEIMRQENKRMKLEFEEKTKQIEHLEYKLSQSNQIKNEQCEEIAYLKTEIFEGETKRRQLYNLVQDLKGNIRVFCRLRPPLTEEEERSTCNFNMPNEKTVCMSKQSNIDWQEFSFDRVFNFRSSQVEVFDELSQLVQSALDGYHVCVFAYGQTGSGKKFTMQGQPTPELTGMIPRSIDLIFETKNKMEKKGWTYQIYASFLEIYNETIRDLLDLKSDKVLKIQFNEGKGTTVSNLTKVEFKSGASLMSYMYKAHQNRSTAVTNLNEHSARSHAVTKIEIEGKCNDSIFLGSVSLVDLAGSESPKEASIERLPETININKSLSALGNVMMSLHKGNNHVPFRNSKLTYLLQSSLGGNCKCLMIVNISPTENSYNESLNALRFGAKVKEVKTETTRNRIVQQTPQRPT